MEVGLKEGGFQRVVDVRVAGFAHLAAVALVGKGVCLTNKLSCFLGQVFGNPVNQDLGVICRYPNSVTLLPQRSFI